jgi:hypothetical protein
MPDYPDIAATSETWQSADAVAETVRWQCRAGAMGRAIPTRACRSRA